MSFTGLRWVDIEVLEAWKVRTLNMHQPVTPWASLVVVQMALDREFKILSPQIRQAFRLCLMALRTFDGLHRPAQVFSSPGQDMFSKAEAGAWQFLRPFQDMFSEAEAGGFGKEKTEGLTGRKNCQAKPSGDQIRQDLPKESFPDRLWLVPRPRSSDLTVLTTFPRHVQLCWSRGVELYRTSVNSTAHSLELSWHLCCYYLTVTP